MRRALNQVPDGQVERAIERFAAVALAGELATKAGLTAGRRRGEGRGDVAVADLADQPDGGGCLSAKEVLDITQDWLRTNAGMVLTQADYDTGMIVGSFRAARDKTWIYVATDLWASIHGAEDATASARALVKLESWTTAMKEHPA